MAQIILPEGAAPATPASGNSVIYPKADGLWYSKDDAGTESIMSGAALAGSATQTFSGAPATAAAHFVRADQLSTDNTNFPIYTPKTAFSTSLSVTSGAFTSAVASLSYIKVKGLVVFSALVTITTNGTAGGTIIITLPSNPSMSESYSCREYSATGVSGAAHSLAGSNNLYITKYDASYIGGDGRVIIVSGSYIE